MTSFWKNWLRVWVVGVAVFGLVLCGAAFADSDGAARIVFELFDNPMPGNPDALHRFALGLVGAVTLGWGLSMGVLFEILFDTPRDRAARGWRAFTVAFLLWYVVDNAISIATGFWLNAVSNTLFLLAYLVAVVASGALRKT